MEVSVITSIFKVMKDRFAEEKRSERHISTYSRKLIFCQKTLSRRCQIYGLGIKVLVSISWTNQNFLPKKNDFLRTNSVLLPCTVRQTMLVTTCFFNLVIYSFQVSNILVQKKLLNFSAIVKNSEVAPKQIFGNSYYKVFSSIVYFRES
jgi:hypothetical protein